MKLACLTVMAALTLPVAAESSTVQKYKLGDNLAGVTLRKLDGKPVKLTAYAGKTLVLIFQGSFSRTAKGVAREVERRLKPKLSKNVVVVYVHVEPAVAAATFRKEQGLTGETWVDPKAELLIKLGYKSVPAAAIIDAKSVLRYADRSFSRAKLETKVKQITGDQGGG